MAEEFFSDLRAIRRRKQSTVAWLPKHPDAAAPAPSGRVIADERAKECLYCFRFRPTATEGLAARPGSWRKIAGRHQNWRDAVAGEARKVRQTCRLEGTKTNWSWNRAT